jgi:hypothetical protein
LYGRLGRPSKASGSSSGGSSGGSSGTTVLFTQPQESDIAGHFSVPVAVRSPAPIGVFEMILWQANPSSSNGQLVPTGWNAGSMTGFSPSSPLESMQQGFQNTTSTSRAQMDADTVGAYINSADLPGSPVGQKMIITPQFTFTPGNEPVPFSTSGSSLGASMYTRSILHFSQTSFLSRRLRTVRRRLVRHGRVGNILRGQSARLSLSLRSIIWQQNILAYRSQQTRHNTCFRNCT